MAAAGGAHPEAWADGSSRLGGRGVGLSRLGARGGRALLAASSPPDQQDAQREDDGQQGAGRAERHQKHPPGHGAPA